MLGGALGAHGSPGVSLCSVLVPGGVGWWVWEPPFRVASVGVWGWVWGPPCPPTAGAVRKQGAARGELWGGFASAPSEWLSFWGTRWPHGGLLLPAEGRTGSPGWGRAEACATSPRFHFHAGRQAATTHLAAAPSSTARFPFPASRLPFAILLLFFFLQSLPQVEGPPFHLPSAFPPPSFPRCHGAVLGRAGGAGAEHPAGVRGRTPGAEGAAVGLGGSRTSAGRAPAALPQAKS